MYQRVSGVVSRMKVESQISDLRSQIISDLRSQISDLFQIISNLKLISNLKFISNLKCQISNLFQISSLRKNTKALRARLAKRLLKFFRNSARERKNLTNGSRDRGNLRRLRFRTIGTDWLQA